MAELPDDRLLRVARNCPAGAIILATPTAKRSSCSADDEEEVAFRHVVMFRLGAGTTDEQKEAVRAALQRLPEVIPEIRAYRFGDDAGLRDDNFDFAVTADFDDVDSFSPTATIPTTRRRSPSLMAPIVATRAAVQFEWAAALPPDLPG